MTHCSKGRALFFTSFFVAILPLIAVSAWAEDAGVTRVQDAEARLRRDVTFLASDECEGRGPATKGLSLAADYIADEFKKAGLKPGNPDGTYFQDFTIPANVLQAAPTLVLKGPRGQVIELKPGVQFDAMGLGVAGAVTVAPVVFAGYGVGSEGARYDDYENLNVAGKVVVLLRGVPRPTMADFGGKLQAQAAFVSKLGRAKRMKALGVLFVQDADTARTGDEPLDFNYTAIGQGGPTGNLLPALFMRRALLETMLRGNGSGDLSDLEKSIDRDWKPQSRELEGWTVSLSVKMAKSVVHLKNVIGVLEGAGPLAKQTVVVGAHYDHLGYGGAGGSMAGLKKPAIHHGADDNGSGSTSIMELARRFAAMPNRQGRRLVFMTFSGEELGLLGSRHYCEKPLYPLQDTAAMFNLDMVGRLKVDPKSKKETLLVEGANTAKLFDEVLASTGSRHNIALHKGTEIIPDSDHFSFYDKKVRFILTDKAMADLKAAEVPAGVLAKLAELKGKKLPEAEFLAAAGKLLSPEELKTCKARLLRFAGQGIPILFFWTGVHPDYHKPSDTADKINVSGMRRIVDLSEDVILQLATLEQRPEFVRVNIGSRSGGPTNIPRLGFAPEYGKEVEGILVGGVRPGTPAAKAGLQPGDIIGQLARKPVKNMQGYMQIMGGFKKGDTIELGIIRDGKPLTLKATLE